MIARTWRGSTTGSNAEGYRRHFADSVRPALDAIPGHRGAFLLERQDAATSRVEFVVMTLWESMGAIHAFAGAEPDRAVVNAEARAVLAEFDGFVRHYEVALDTRA